MFDIKWIRANPEAFDAALKERRNVPSSAADLIAIDERRRAAQLQLDDLLATRNAKSKEIGQAKAQKDETRATALMAEVASLKDRIPTLEQTQRDAEKQLADALAIIPNLPLDDVPRGEDETANREYFGRNGSPETAAKVRAERPTFSFKPQEHFVLGEATGNMDFEIAAKLSGSRFVVLKSDLARLERAIGQFMLDLHVDEHGYTEVEPPLMVNDASMWGTGQLPKFREDQYYSASGTIPKELDHEEIRGLVAELEPRVTKMMAGYDSNLADLRKLISADVPFQLDAKALEESVSNLKEFASHIAFSFLRHLASYTDFQKKLDTDRLWLIPTAEVPLTNLVRESILAEDQLPLRYTALTPCFRSEAGSAGRDTRGMIRQHQFNKVEMVAITTPETSTDEHEKMLTDAEDVLQKLGLHYRVMTLSTGDMGFGAQKTYDLEVWLPGQDQYREISSVSVCGDFQARRMDARVKGKDGKIRYAHTLNGSGVAVGRALVAVMENYQDEDGSIAIPDVLVPYMRGRTRIGAKS